MFPFTLAARRTGPFHMPRASAGSGSSRMGRTSVTDRCEPLRAHVLPAGSMPHAC